MKRSAPITALFLDIGGVLLTDGWDHHARKRAATHFKLELTEMEDRHHLTFDTYEEGKLTLEEYLGRVVFHQKRSFTRAQFRRFMFAQSKPYPQMIELVRKLKPKFGLKIAVVSNEGRELNAYRIRKFKLAGFVDSFVSSSFVQVAEGLGIRSILHTDYRSTCAKLASLGLPNDEGSIPQLMKR